MPKSRSHLTITIRATYERDLLSDLALSSFTLSSARNAMRSARLSFASSKIISRFLCIKYNNLYDFLVFVICTLILLLDFILDNLLKENKKTDCERILIEVSFTVWKCDYEWYQVNFRRVTRDEWQQKKNTQKAFILDFYSIGLNTRDDSIAFSI